MTAEAKQRRARPSVSSVHFNSAANAPNGGQTVIVLGCGRGGTSAIAGALRALGVAFPDGTHPLKHESSPILYRGQSVDRRATYEELRSMDKRFDRWGWKSPKDVFFIHDWVSMVRNPVFIIVFRNQIQTTRSVMKWERVDFEVAARHVGEVYAELGRFVAKTPFPTAMLDYDELCTSPHSILSEISEWLHCPVPKRHLAAACNFVTIGSVRRYKTLGGEAGGKLGFSAEELAQDQKAAQAELYSNEIADLSLAIEALSADILRAQNVVADLRGGAETAMDLEYSQTDLPPRSYTGEMEPAARYRALRNSFARTSLRRLKLQNEMDTLVWCIEPQPD